MKMTRRERFLATIEYQPVDRPASWLGLFAPESCDRLMRHLGVGCERSLKEALNDDLWAVEVPYRHPPSNHIACAFDFAISPAGGRTLTATGFFAGCRDPEVVDTFA